MEIQDAPRWLDMWGVLSMARLMNPTMHPSNACSGCEPANARRPGFKWISLRKQTMATSAQEVATKSTRR